MARRKLCSVVRSKQLEATELLRSAAVLRESNPALYIDRVRQAGEIVVECLAYESSLEEEG